MGRPRSPAPGPGKARPATGVHNHGRPPPGLADGAARVMYQDTFGYLPDDILCKIDRAAMAVSLETRVPLLDHRLLECAWRMPMNLKIRDGQGKWALRQVLCRHVPQSLIDRPKTGFSIPVGDWLRGPLRDWAEQLLAPERLRWQGMFMVASVRAIWDQHLSGQGSHTGKLWAILMFQAWFEAETEPQHS